MRWTSHAADPFTVNVVVAWAGIAPKNIGERGMKSRTVRVVVAKLREKEF